MLESFSGKVILTKIKAMYGQRVTDSDYEQLLHRASVSECAAYLKARTHYGAIMRDIQESQIHRGALEALLSREIFQRFCRLYHYGGRCAPLYREVYIGRIEIDCILNCLRLMDAKTQNEFISTVPGYLAGYTSFDVLSLGQVSDLSSLLRMLQKTVYQKVLVGLRPGENGRISLPEAERLLYEDYYRRMALLVRRLYRGKARDELLGLLSVQQELMSLCALYRIKSYFNSHPELVDSAVQQTRGRLRKRVVEGLRAAPDAASLLWALSRTPYAAYFVPEEFSHIEYATGRIIYDLSKRYLTFSQRPATVFLSFLLLQEIEKENLINIIEGVRYGSDTGGIRSLLIVGGAS